MPKIHPSTGIKKAEKARRRQEAEERNGVWKDKPLEEKIRIICSKPGACLKQWLKLEKQYGKEAIDSAVKLICG